MTGNSALCVIWKLRGGFLEGVPSVRGLSKVVTLLYHSSTHTCATLMFHHAVHISSHSWYLKIVLFPSYYCRYCKRSLTWRRTLSFWRRPSRTRKLQCRWLRPAWLPARAGPTWRAAATPYSTGGCTQQHGHTQNKKPIGLKALLK